MCERHTTTQNKMMWAAQHQLAKMLPNCRRRIELVSILANVYSNLSVLATCILPANKSQMYCSLSTNQNSRSLHVICVKTLLAGIWCVKAQVCRLKFDKLWSEVKGRLRAVPVWKTWSKWQSFQPLSCPLGGLRVVFVWTVWCLEREPRLVPEQV